MEYVWRWRSQLLMRLPGNEADQGEEDNSLGGNTKTSYVYDTLLVFLYILQDSKLSFTLLLGALKR